MPEAFAIQLKVKKSNTQQQQQQKKNTQLKYYNVQRVVHSESFMVAAAVDAPPFHIAIAIAIRYCLIVSWISNKLELLLQKHVVVLHVCMYKMV